MSIGLLKLFSEKILTMEKNKIPKNGRDIYEATEQDYDTSDYRRKLCNEWLSYQQAQPANLHQPTDLESIAPGYHTQKSKLRRRQKRQTNTKHGHDNAKKSKHAETEFGDFLDFNMDGKDDFDNKRKSKSLKDDYFLDEPLQIHQKIKATAKHEIRKHHVESRRHHVSSNVIGHSKDAFRPPTNKCRHDLKNYVGFDFDRYQKDPKHDFDFDFPNDDFKLDEEFDEVSKNKLDDLGFIDTEKRGQVVSSTAKSKHYNEHDFWNETILPKPVHYERKPNVFETPKLYGYKMIKETQYLTTPTWDTPTNDAFKLKDADRQRGRNKELVPARADRQYDTMQHAYSQYVEKPVSQAKMGLNFLGSTVLEPNSNGRPINIYCNSLIKNLVIKSD